MKRIVYQSRDGRVTLNQHSTRPLHLPAYSTTRVHQYSVTIAGGTYGPFCWAEALEWYSRQKSIKN